MQYDNETKQMITEIENKMKELQDKVDELKNGGNKCVRWRAEKDDWYVDGNGYTRRDSRDFTSTQDFETGQYFKTDADAKCVDVLLI